MILRCEFISCNPYMIVISATMHMHANTILRQKENNGKTTLLKSKKKKKFDKVKRDRIYGY